MSLLLRCGIPLSVGDVFSATGPKDTFDESALVQSPCEDDVNRGLVDGGKWISAHL